MDDQAPPTISDATAHRMLHTLRSGERRLHLRLLALDPDFLFGLFLGWQTGLPPPRIVGLPPDAQCFGVHEAPWGAGRRVYFLIQSATYAPTPEGAWPRELRFDLTYRTVAAPAGQPTPAYRVIDQITILPDEAAP